MAITKAGGGGCLARLELRRKRPEADGRRQALSIENQLGAPEGADFPSVFVFDEGIPDLGGSSTMQHAGAADHEAACDRAKQIAAQIYRCKTGC